MALWRKMTYHRRLFAGLVVYSLALAACFAVFQYMREKEFKAEELNARLQTVNDRILTELADGEPVSRFDIPSQLPGLRISVIDTSGNVIHDNTLDSLPGSNHLDRREIADAMRRGEGYTTRRHSSSTGQTYFYSAMRRGDYVVRTAVPYSVSTDQLLQADYGFLWFMGVIMTLMCVIGYFATRRLGQHVRRLNRFAESAERGERIHDTDPFPRDELGEISNHIVRLYARLQQATADRDREHRQALHQEQEKIRIKRQLTDNINHELKTPVASMGVCLETLVAHPDMEPAKRDEFVRRCLTANSRLQNLLADVSAVTRLEEGGASITREAIDPAAVVADVCAEYEPAARESGITIVNTVSCPGPVNGNSALLASVFRNLMANAIAYSGGTEISLSQHIAGNRLIITVADNGSGVAPEHLPRLFERFYRVDKGRSRQMGGTGLGLAIVKNAVIWHRGTVAVENRVGGGLAVTVSLPLA